MLDNWTLHSLSSCLQPWLTIIVIYDYVSVLLRCFIDIKIL